MPILLLLLLLPQLAGADLTCLQGDNQHSILIAPASEDPQGGYLLVPDGAPIVLNAPRSVYTPMVLIGSDSFGSSDRPGTRPGPAP